MSRTPAEPIYLAAKDVAQRWHVSLAHVYRLKDAGKLSYVLLGTAVRFRLEDIEAYEQAGYVAAPITPLQLRGRLRA